MNVFDFFNLYLLENKKLIYFLLQSIKDCIPKEYREKYVLQLDCINKIQWVLDVEANLYFDNDNLCKEYLISKWEQEKKIAEIVLTVQSNKKYIVNFFVVNGRIFSIESNLPFRYLKLSQIQDIEILCNKEVENKS